MFFEYPPQILELKSKISPYRARSANEDRGDGFIAGTPDIILEYHKTVLDFVRGMTTAPDGKLLI